MEPIRQGVKIGGNMILILWMALSMLKVVTNEYIYNERFSNDGISNINYKLELLLSEISEKYNNFDGNLRISFNYDSEVPPKYFSLYTSLESLQINKIKFNDSYLSEENFEILNSTSLIKLYLKDIKNGKNNINIEYRGYINTENDTGIYKNYYFTGKKKHYYLTTNLAPYYSKQLFPNFGEMNSKAAFELVLTIPKEMQVIANTKAIPPATDSNVSLHRIVIKKTHAMMPSSIELVIGNLTCTDPEKILGNIRYELCYRPDLQLNTNITDFPKEAVKQMLQYFNRFTQYNYSTYMEKISHVAFPGIDYNTIAKWGLIGSGENNIFWSKYESSNKDQQKIATLIAIQISQQWFGNLVAVNTTLDQAIIQGFAEYFSNVALQDMFPSWDLEKLFVIENFQNALAMDSSDLTNDISKIRGASLLRMVEHMLQLNSWEESIQEYILNNILGIAKSEDIWKILDKLTKEKLPVSLPEILENWAANTAYPLLTVNIDGDAVIVTQESFIAKDNKHRWYIPISYTTSKDKNFKYTKPQFWLQPTSEFTKITTLSEQQDWILLNNKETGYYRVNYDKRLWQNIKMALTKKNFDGIEETKRAQIVDDLFSLAIYDKMNFYQILEFLTFLELEVSYYTWYSAFKGYSFLLNRVGYSSTLGGIIGKNILRLLEKNYDSINIEKLSDETSHIDVLNAEQVFHWACKLGNKNCIQKIQEIFKDSVMKNVTINRNLKKVVFCNTLRYSTNSEDWNFMWNMFKHSPSDIITNTYIISSLACTTDPILLKRYLHSAIGENFMPEDIVYIFKTIIEENFEGLQTAREFIVENFNRIVKRIPLYKQLEIIIIGIVSQVTKDDELEMFENFINKKNLHDDHRFLFIKAINIGKNNLNWLKRHKNDIENFYMYGDIIGSTSALSIFFTAMYLLVIFCLFNRQLFIDLFVKRYENQIEEDIQFEYLECDPIGGPLS